jgi:drug/metabolite transporter (DMT)-like permease
MRTAALKFLGNGKKEGASMLYRAGRAFQIAGMILLPIAIAGNIAPEQPLDLRASLTLSGVGVGVFAVGYLMQQIGRQA